MSSKPYRVIAAVVIRDGRFLVCRRPLAKPYGGLWEFPGGKCEPGETDVDTISRELREELDVEALEVGAEDFSTVDSKGEFSLIFRPVEIIGNPMPREHSDLRWLSLQQLLQLPLVEGDQQYVRFLLNRSQAVGQAEI